MRKLLCSIALASISSFSLLPVEAAYLILIDTDGADDGVVTFNSHFSFANDTTTASQSIASSAYGLSPHDSIFGGDGANQPDTYRYEYAPTVDVDNLAIPAGQDLGEGDLASGLTGGSAGTYAVYATWPATSNVSGGPTRYQVTTLGDAFSIDINQNDVDLGEMDGRGDAWAKIGEIVYASGSIVVTQQPTITNSFVSMRSSAVMFELIPEPSSLLFLGLGGFGLLRRRRVAIGRPIRPVTPSAGDIAC